MKDKIDTEAHAAEQIGATPRPAFDLSWITTTCAICGHREPLITGDADAHWRSHSWWERLFKRTP